MPSKAHRNPLVLACSPRLGGNSDIVAATIRQELPGASLLHLRNYPVLPCISCGYCADNPGTTCPQEEEDSSRKLFEAIHEAAELVVVAPIYFYHLPAQFKAFIDRSQPIWTKQDASGSFPPATRTAHAILLGGRKTGKRLFEGSLLTLRLWLDLFGFSLADPLTLYGLDAAGDAADAGVQDTVRQYVEGWSAPVARTPGSSSHSV